MTNFQASSLTEERLVKGKNFGFQKVLLLRVEEMLSTKKMKAKTSSGLVRLKTRPCKLYTTAYNGIHYGGFPIGRSFIFLLSHFHTHNYRLTFGGGNEKVILIQ